MLKTRQKICSRPIETGVKIVTDDWRNQQERSNPVALHLIRWIAQKLGRRPARVLLYPITFYYLLFAGSQRKASMHYLRRVLHTRPTWLNVVKHIHCFASTILDRVFLLSGQFDKLDINFPIVNLPLAYSEQGTGCLLLGSHLGSFEILRSYAIKHCPLPIKILMYEDHSPMVISMLNALDPNAANGVILLGKPDSFLEVKDAIDAGFAIGMLGDRAMDDDKITRCSLLGDPVVLPTAPFVIAAVLKVPIILFFGIYLGDNRYQIHFELLTEHIDLNRQNRQQEIHHWAQEYASRLEIQMKKTPYNWFNFFDYWHDEPGSK